MIEIKLKDFGFDSTIKRLRKSKASAVSVGYFADAKYPNGEQVANVAAIQEGGAEVRVKDSGKIIRIPPRPFIAPSIEAVKKEIPNMLDLYLSSDSYTIRQLLKLIGLVHVKEIKKAIKAVYEPTLSPVTIQNRLKRRKNKKITATLTKPLVDTKVLLTSVSFKVK